MHTKSTNRHPTHALYEAEAGLIKFRQGDDMTNSNFLEKFKSLMPAATPDVPPVAIVILSWPMKTPIITMPITKRPSDAVAKNGSVWSYFSKAIQNAITH